jgi:hypothetical protein
MARRKGSRAWWMAQLVELYRRQPEMTIREFTEAFDVPFGQLHYRLYDSSWEKHRAEARRRAGQNEETRLVAVDVDGIEFVEEKPGGSSRWLEAVSPRGIRLRFLEGTGSEYVADLMTRIASRGA